MEFKKNEELRKLIQAKFRTQQNFAAAIRVQDTEVSKVIAGARILSLPKKQKYAEALGVGVEKIFPMRLAV